VQVPGDAAPFFILHLQQATGELPERPRAQ
jgi:hypothetical protein